MITCSYGTQQTVLTAQLFSHIKRNAVILVYKICIENQFTSYGICNTFVTTLLLKIVLVFPLRRGCSTLLLFFFQCLQVSVKSCRCGARQKELPCAKSYTCETRCQKMKSCGRHACKKRCCDGLTCSQCDQPCNKKLNCKYLMHAVVC